MCLYEVFPFLLHDIFICPARLSWGKPLRLTLDYGVLTSREPTCFWFYECGGNAESFSFLLLQHLNFQHLNRTVVCQGHCNSVSLMTDAFQVLTLTSKVMWKHSVFGGFCWVWGFFEAKPTPRLILKLAKFHNALNWVC